MNFRIQIYGKSSSYQHIHIFLNIWNKEKLLLSVIYGKIKRKNSI